jgi:radical SAM protein with 4Fe4S-binding SPASM domain
MSVKLNDKSFCIFPFVQVVVRTDGSMMPCCIMKGKTNIRDSDLEQYWQSDELKKIQNDILAGVEHIPECKQCYDAELDSGKSVRTTTLLDYKFYNKQHYEKIFNHYNYLDNIFPTRVEMHVGNICNLKCITCRPQDSSSFLAEDSALGISNFRQSDYQIDDSILTHNLELIMNHNVEILDLRGGESMLSPKIKKILLDLPESKCQRTLRIQTNATILDEDWKIILNKFKKIEIMASIDAYGQDNYYIRYPADWEVIEKNIDYFQTLPNLKLYINCTISNLNFLLIDKLIEWTKSKKIYFYYSLLTHPQYYHYTNLPTELFEVAQKKLLNYPEIVLSGKPSTQHWKQFCDMIDLRDQYRKSSIFNILPELKKWWL